MSSPNSHGKDVGPNPTCLVTHTMASPQAAALSGMAQDVNQWFIPLKPPYRPSVNNMKARTQHVLTVKEPSYDANGHDIAELTKVARVAPDGTQGVHHKTMAEELPTVDPSLKGILDKQFKKMGDGSGAKEHKLYIPGAIILNKLTRLWYKSYLNPPFFIIIHLVNPKVVDLGMTCTKDR